MLRERLDELAAEPRDKALIRYMSANTGQGETRTVALLQRFGLLTPKITGSEAGLRLGVHPSASTNSATRSDTASNKHNHPKMPAVGCHRDPVAIESVLSGP